MRGSRSRKEKWRNACSLTRTQRRLVLVACQQNTEKLRKRCGPRMADQENLSDSPKNSQKTPVRNANGPLNLAIIQRRKTDVWYAKFRMGERKLGCIMKTLAQALDVDGKRISNQSTRKTVVKKARKQDNRGTRLSRSPAMRTKACSTTTTRLVKTKGGLYPSS